MTTYAGDIINVTDPAAVAQEVEAYVRDPAFGAILFSQWLPRSTAVTTYDALRRLSLSARAGDVAYFQADFTNGVWWQLLYEPDGGSYPWKYIGGPSIYAQVDTQQSTTSATYVDLATVGPSITLPAAGDYDVAHGALTQAAATSGNLQAVMSYAIGAATAQNADAIDSYGPTVEAQIGRTRRKTGLAASTTLTAKYGIGTGTGTAFYANRWIAAKPVRIG